MPDTAVVVAAADAGSARATAPVARLLEQRGIIVGVLADGPAVGILRDELPVAPRLDGSDASTVDDLEAMIRGAGAQLVLTGAGSYNAIEHRARLAARAAGVPAIAVLDYWFEYAARFHRPGDAEPSWPDVVCAIDARSRDGLVAAGADPASVVITGPPNLEDSVKWLRAHASRRDALARELGVTRDGPIAAFFSEPHRRKPDGRLFDGPGGLHHAGGEPVFGYTALEMLGRTADAFARAAQDGRAVRLLVKPHPLEWEPALREAVAAHPYRDRIQIVEHAHPRHLVAVADAVVGMSSVTLLEAALAGTPSFSVQIGLGARAPFDPCAGNALGVTSAVFDQPALDAAARDISLGRARIRRDAASIPIDGAAARVAELVATRLALPTRL